MQRQVGLLRKQEDALLNLRLAGDVTGKTYTAKSTELRDRIATLQAKIKAAGVDRTKQAETAAKKFELSQGSEKQ